MNVRIEKPHIALLPSFLEFGAEMAARGETLWDGYYPKDGESKEAFIERQIRRAINPEPPLVPETVYWAVTDDQVVGRISLRHCIEGRLLIMGGHIGYEVRPSYRRHGIAREILRQVLLTPRAIEIGRLLLTCSPDNVASNKTILANGGKLTETVYVNSEYGHKNHYWIDLTSTMQT